MIDIQALDILIVEDESLIARNIQLHLAHKGIESIRIFDNADDTLNSVKDRLPSIILMDYYIKGSMTGDKLAHTIRSMNCQTPIIFMTAYSDSDTISELNRYTPCRILSKPFQFPILFRHLEELIENTY